MTENANESPPTYCFFLLYCLNLIAQFDTLFLRTLKNSTPKDQTERKNVLFETPETREGKKKIETPTRKNHPKTRLRDSSKTSLPRFRDRAKISWDPRFSRYHSIPLLFCQKGVKILLRRRQRERHSNNFAGTCSTVLVHLSSSLPTMWIV